MFPENFICFFRFFVFENFPNFSVCLEFVDGHSIFTTGSWEFDRPLVWDWPECSLDTWEAASDKEAWMAVDLANQLDECWKILVVEISHLCFTLETLDISLISDNWQFDTTQRWIQQLRHCPKKHTHDRYLHVPWTGPLQKCLFSQTLCE